MSRQSTAAARANGKGGTSIYDNSFVAFSTPPQPSLYDSTHTLTGSHTQSQSTTQTRTTARQLLQRRVSPAFEHSQWNSSAPDLTELCRNIDGDTDKQQSNGSWKERLQNIEVSLLVIALVIVATAQALVTKKTGYAMHRFPYFILLVVSFAFVPLFFAMVLFIQFKSGGFSQHTKTASLHLKFCVVGALNALNGMCVIFANPHVPGSLQQIMVQAVMPITMGMSIVILGSKFHRLQLLGALMICMGVIIELYPLFIGSKGPGGGLEISPGAVDDAQMHSHELLTSGTQTSTYPYAYRYTSGSAIVSTGAKNNAQQSQPPAYFWSMVFLLGQVPMGMQSVFQELAFSQAHVNVVYMMAWSSLAQFLSLCVLSVFNFIPKFGAVAPGDFGEYMKESLQCARGYGDGCEQAPVLLTCFVMIMLTAQIVQALLVKKSSAALVVIVLTVITPLSTVCFSIPYLMGEHTEALKISTCVALVVLTVGVIIYRVPDALVLKEGRKCEADESSFTDSDGLHTQRRETEPLLTRKKSRTATTDSDRHPVMLNSRIGVISSEYTGEADISDGIKTILYSHTHLTEGDANAHPTHTHAHTHTMSHSYSNVDA